MPIPITLIHGAATTPRIWRMVVSQLRKALPDSPIHVPERRCSGVMDREIADLWDQCEGAVVVGVSGGATLAWELASRGCPMKAVVAHEPAAGSLVPNLLTYAASAWSSKDIGVPDNSNENLQAQAALFGVRLYGADWNASELPPDPSVVHRDYLMFADFEPQPPQIDPSCITLTVGEFSPKPRYAVARAYRIRFGVPTASIVGAGHCVPLQQPQRFAALIAAVEANL